MCKIMIIELSITECLKLEFGFRDSANHCNHMRCKVDRLKSEGLLSKEIGNQVGMT